MLTTAGVDALLDPPEEATGYVLRHRPARGERWRVVARVATHREAVFLVNGVGDWWISTVADVEPEPGALF